MGTPADPLPEQASSSTPEAEAVLTIEQVKVLWRSTAEGKRVEQIRKILWILIILAGLYSAVRFWWTLSDIIWQRLLWEALGAIVWFVAAALVIGIFDIAYADPKLNNFQAQFRNQQLLASYQADLNTSLELHDLWALNQRRLDIYHQIATDQARSSFRNAQLSAGIGFAIIAAAAIVVWFSKSPTTTITTGALGVFGGSLGAYIGGTFMKVQQGAAQQLRQYFDHPLELSKILISERLIESLPENQRMESVQALTQAIVSGRPTMDASQSPGESGQLGSR